jgi:peptide/nickel transport system substrate-binding protein
MRVATQFGQNSGSAGRPRRRGGARAGARGADRAGDQPAVRAAARGADRAIAQAADRAAVRSGAHGADQIGARAAEQAAVRGGARAVARNADQAVARNADRAVARNADQAVAQAAGWASVRGAFRAVALAIAAILLAAWTAGCAGAQGGTQGATSAEVVAQNAAGAESGASTAQAGQESGQPAAGQESGQPAAEKVFRMSRSWEEASSWDPAALTGNDTAALQPQIYETLLHLDSDGGSSPMLAESWEASADGLSYTFHLREGVQFHKGYGEMTSEDVKFSFERHRDPEVASIHVETLNLANLAAIETPDPLTAVFRLDSPDVDFITRVSMYEATIVSKAAFDAVGLDGFASEPIGTGPFQYDSGVIGGRTEAVKFPEFWGGEPKIDRVVNTIITDTNTNYAAFDNGELDMIYVYYMDKVNEYAGKGYQDFYLPTNQLLYIGVNVQSEPWSDAHVREAFFKAIDPQYYIDQIFYGKETYPGGVIPPKCKYALKDYLKADYDPEGAKRILAEAGFPDGVKTTLWTVNDDISPPPALIAQQQLLAVGIDVELQMVDFGVFIDRVRAGTADMWLLYNSTPPIADETIARYTSAKYPGSNWSGIMDAGYDELVEKGLAAKSEAEKTKHFEDAQKVLMDLNAIYPVTTYGYDFIVSPNVTGIEIWGDNCLRLRNADMQ